MTQAFLRSLAAPCPSAWSLEGNLLPELLPCICQEWPLSFTAVTGLSFSAHQTLVQGHTCTQPVLWPQLLLPQVPGKQCGYCSPALLSQQSLWDASQQTGSGPQPLCLPAFPLVLFLHSEDRGVLTVDPFPPHCSSLGLPNCCHQPASAQAQSRFVGGGEHSELLCWEREQPLFDGLSSLMAFLQQEIPPREKEPAGPGAAPAAVGDQPVSPGEQVPRQPGGAGRGAGEGIAPGRSCALVQPCRRMWSHRVGEALEG